jgi:hypothetical protein
VPNPKKFLIIFNKKISLLCSSILNTGDTRILCFLDRSFTTLIEKEDSASEKPVTQKGESLFVIKSSLLKFLIGAIINPVPK